MILTNNYQQSNVEYPNDKQNHDIVDQFDLSGVKFYLNFVFIDKNYKIIEE